MALYEVTLVGLGLCVGYSGLFGTPAYLALTWAALAVLLGVAYQRRKTLIGSLASVSELSRAELGRVPSVVAIMGVWLLGIQVAMDATIGTSHFDGLAYHITRALFWLWHGNFAAWLTPYWPEIGLPVVADVILSSKVFLGTGWRGIAYVSMWLTIGAAACVYVGGRSIGLTRHWAVVAALLFLSFPSVGQRVVGGNSDIAASFPALASAAILLLAADLGLGGACALVLCSVAIAAKPTVLIPLLLANGLALFWRRHTVRFREVSLAPLCAGAACATAILLGSYWPVIAEFGDLIGGDEGRENSNLGAGAAAMVKAAAWAILQWTVEPLGYVPKPLRESMFHGLGLSAAYEWLGAHGDKFIPSGWPEQTSTGISALLLFALAVSRATRGIRIFGLLLVACFLLSAALVAVQPWSSRFHVAIYAMLAMAGVRAACASGAPGERWCTILLAGAMAVAAIGTTLWASRQLNDYRSESGIYAFLPDKVRVKIESTVGTRPLLVLGAGGSRTALISGPDASLRFEYLTCERRRSLSECLRAKASHYPLLGVIFDKDQQLHYGASSNQSHWLTGTVNRDSLHSQLLASGWHPVTDTAGIQLWASPSRR